MQKSFVCTGVQYDTSSLVCIISANSVDVSRALANKTMPYAGQLRRAAGPTPKTIYVRQCLMNGFTNQRDNSIGEIIPGSSLLNDIRAYNVTVANVHECIQVCSTRANNKDECASGTFSRTDKVNRNMHHSQSSASYRRTTADFCL